MRQVPRSPARAYRSALCVAAMLTAAAGCSNSGRARDASGITPAYDAATGKLKELAFDSNHDGRVDTWTDMDGARAVQTRIDGNQDGKVDRWEYYDSSSALVKVGFSRGDDGKPDAWAFAGADGTIERIEISSTANPKKIDRWEHYGQRGLTAAEEDTDHDGAADKWETYDSGIVATASFDENGDGKADRKLTYSGGTLVAIESEPDTAGKFRKKLDVKPPSDPVPSPSPR